MIPVLALHGFMGAPKDFEPLAHLSPLEFYAMPLPGHTGGVQMDSYRLSDFAAAILQNAPARFHFLGYSLGGRIGYKMYELAPNRFQSFTVLASAPGVRDPSALSERENWQNHWSRLLEGDFGVFLQKWYEQNLFAALSSEQKQVLIEQRRTQNSKLLKKILVESSQAQNPHSWDVVKVINCPALYVAGRLDQKYVNIGLQVVAENPHFELKILDRFGHALLVGDTECLKRLSTTLTDFWQSAL